MTNQESVLRGQRILITGGTGFIGSALAHRLSAENDVVIFDRQVQQSTWALNGRNGGAGRNGHANVRVLEGDVLDARAVARAVEGADSIVHLAAIVGVNNVRARPRETLETNFLGTLTLLRAAQRLRRLPRFVYFSTSEVFGISSYRVRESVSASIGPVQEARWCYAISKLVGEHLLQCYHRELGLPTVTIRPFNVFGPGRTGDHAVLRFIVGALTGEDLIVHGSGDQIRSWCYIDDFIDGVVAALARPEAVGEDFNLGNPRNTLTIYELAKRVLAITQSACRIRLEDVNYADVDIRVPDMGKAHQILGFDPQVDMDVGLRRTAAWCQQHLPSLLARLSAAAEPACAPHANNHRNGRSKARDSVRRALLSIVSIVGNPLLLNGEKLLGG